MTELFDPVSVDISHPSLNHKRFTSDPLSEDLEVTGYPTVVLWASTSHPHDSTCDAGDVFAMLQCVESTGEVAYVTEGSLRLKHRHFFHDSQSREFDSCCEATDLAMAVTIPNTPKRSFRSEHAKLGPLGSGGHSPELVWLTMQPVSFLFKRSQRIQLAIYGSDVTHFAPCADKTYDLKIWLGDQESSSHELSYGSWLLLPVVVD